MRTIVIGLDAYDPLIFEQLLEIGRVPNLAKIMNKGGYSHFEVSNPPQSEVSWTSIASGLNPGEHGIFDFVHREPETYTPYVSLLPTAHGFGGIKYDHPTTVRTIFEEITRMGYPATALWWPVTFPARLDLPVQTLPGLGTPDITGKLGVGNLFTTDRDLLQEENKTRISLLIKNNKKHYIGELIGPERKLKIGTKSATLNFSIELLDDKNSRLTIDGSRIYLERGKWSQIFEVTFKLGFMMSIHALTRVILTDTEPDVRLYFLPLQIHPLRSPWKYATPRGFVRNIWRNCGPFLTIGWPQDTIGLEEGWITNDQFLSLCDDVFERRENIFMHLLNNYNEGILACVFDSLDRIQHMFLNYNREIVNLWYEKFDLLIGVIQNKLLNFGHDDTKLVVVSDHGFTNFDYKVHLNHWLIEAGVLKTKDSHKNGDLKEVAWGQTSGYAVGLNGIYMNLLGREGNGIVTLSQVDNILNNLSERLLSWIGPDGRPVIRSVWRNDEVFEGKLSKHGPDLVIGYNTGYRASSQTGLGAWKEISIEPNNDHWSADHCVDPRCVPGVLFSSKGFRNMSKFSYREFPELVLGRSIESKESPPPSIDLNEDNEVIEDRLKSLGYL